MVDPIADMLTRIRNAQAAEHKTVVFPFSKIKLEITKILKQEEYIGDFKKLGKDNEKMIEISLKYPSAIREIKRISKQGQRIYTNSSGLKQIKNNYGMSIISTSKGLMTNKSAHKMRLGGEILFEIW
ncbi:MAG: 30S ribosomal protein S8 [Candidatus Azambacteria bacterium]|nr:30S ribosomal protein S8 [Candidatus Azambacteria bacterium]